MFAGLISPLFPSGGLNKKPGTIFFDGDSPAILSPAVYIKKELSGREGKLPVLYRIPILPLSKPAEEAAIFLLTCCQLL